MFHKAENRFRSERGEGKKKGGKKGRKKKGEGRKKRATMGWLALLPTEAKFSSLLKAVSEARGDSAEFSYLEEGYN